MCGTGPGRARLPMLAQIGLIVVMTGFQLYQTLID